MEVREAHSWSRSVIFLLIGILFCLSISRFLSLNRSTFLRGADAYYYALQARFLVEKGVMCIPDSSPFIPCLALTSQLGLTYEKTINLWTVFIQLLGVINSLFIWGLAKRRNKVSILTLFLLLSWVMLSPTFFFTSLEFPKYALALAMLPLWLAVFANRRFWLVSMGAVILSCIMHRALIGLLGLSVIGAGLFFVFKRRVWEGLVKTATDTKRKRMIAGSGVVTALLFLAVLKTGYFSWLDLARFDWQNVQPAWITFFGREATPLVLKIEVLLAFLLIGGIITFNAAAKEMLLTLGSWLWLPFIFFIVAFPLGSVEVMGVAERLCLAIPLVAVIFVLSLSSDSREKKDCVVRSSRVKKIVISFVMIGVSFLLLLVQVFPDGYLKLVHPEQLNPDYGLYDAITKILAEQEIDMLIAHRGLNFYYKYQTLQEAFHYEPEDHWPKELIWRVVYGISPSEWAFYLPSDFLWESGNLYTLVGPYSLIREDGWVKFRDSVRNSKDVYLQERVFSLWLNPVQRRPAFLYRKHSEEEGVFSARPKN